MGKNKNIILIGMPAAGKSTAGIILAKKLGYNFMDTDILIQTAEKKMLPELIREKGMDGFCKTEEKHILSINASSHVIATGGSVIYGKAGMEHLKAKGIVVYLETSSAPLKDRIADPQQRGVVRKPGQTIESLLRERTPLYSFWADIIIDCDHSGSPVQTTELIISALTGEKPQGR